jgi:hypothetical protein
MRAQERLDPPPQRGVACAFLVQEGGALVTSQANGSLKQRFFPGRS